MPFSVANKITVHHKKILRDPLSRYIGCSSAAQVKILSGSLVACSMVQSKIFGLYYVMGYLLIQILWSLRIFLWGTGILLATLNGMHLLLIGNWAPSLFRIGGIDCYSPPSVPSCSPFSAFVFTLQCPSPFSVSLVGGGYHSVPLLSPPSLTFSRAFAAWWSWSSS